MSSKDYSVNEKKVQWNAEDKGRKIWHIAMQDEFRISTYNLFNYQCQLHKMLPSEIE